MLVNMYLRDDPAGGTGYGEQSLALARELGLPEQLAYVTTDLGAAYTLTGRLEQAEASLREADHLWRELGNLPMLGFDLSLLMVVLVLRGKYETLSKLGAEARHDLDRLDTRWSQGPMLVFETAGLLEQGEFGRALEALQESLPLLEKEGRSAFTEMARAHQFWAHLLAGDAETAQEMYRQFHRPPAEIAQHPYIPWVLGVYALYEIASGQLEAAEATLSAGADANSAVAACWMALARCQLAYARGDYRAAASLAAEAVGRMLGNGVMHLLAACYYMKGRAHIMLGEHGEAREALEAGRATAEALGARRILWQILSALADEEADAGQAARLRGEARETASYVAGHAGPLENAFRALPEVRAISEDDQGGIAAE
jgi:tetratricopeptide (TPR) repeat protein